MLHPWHDIHPGKGIPETFWSIIEIPVGSTYKYELDKPTGLLKVDRALHSAVYYPANYGFIPQTYANDDDPLDVLVLGAAQVHPLTLIEARAIGMMTMKDNNDVDDKIIAVHIHDPEYSHYQDIAELPVHKLNVLQRFFEDYKILESKEVIVERFRDRFEAHAVIAACLKEYERKLHDDVPMEGTEAWYDQYRDSVKSISELINRPRRRRPGLLKVGEEAMELNTAGVPDSPADMHNNDERRLANMPMIEESKSAAKAAKTARKPTKPKKAKNG